MPRTNFLSQLLASLSPRCLLLPVILVSIASPLRAASDLPQGSGLAAQYPQDVGIETDPRIIFAENFESGTLMEIQKRWSSVSNKDGDVLTLNHDVPPLSAGERSIQMTANLPENTGGHLFQRFSRGYDQVFCRFYVKFPAEPEYIHHFVHLGGYNPPTTYAQGGAGQRPRGDDRFTVGIEPFGEHGRFPPPGIWNFYAYWPEMKISADGRYWGNGIRPAEPARVPAGRWQCVEFMINLNSAPNKSDGELALWLDGELVAHVAPETRISRWTGMGFTLAENDGEIFPGFRWRTSPDLQINFLWLLHYVTEGPARQNKVPRPNPINRVWFDDIVVSTAYVGPLHPSEKDEAAAQDDEYRKLIIGTWEDDYQGKRTMTLRPDGTGTMLVELSGLKATLFASRLRFDMVWSVENARLKKRTIGGEPKARVNMILKSMGDRVSEPILDLTSERLRLQDENGKTEYNWRRVPDANTPPKRES